ncbi:CUB domain-containing protein 1 [Hoplias malabaricus]|uniref:CUB domain-containing protein 1 n=1 Tax=Hoplias malabaricus TaxID=27720 RepID=UPI003463416C
MKKMDVLLLGVLLLLTPQTSEFLQLTVEPGTFSTVTLSTSLSLDLCGICNEIGEDCDTSLKIKPSQSVTVQFNCSEPQKDISVLVESTVECTNTACTPKEGSVPASLQSGFNRRFVWGLKTPPETAVVVNFPGDGLNMVDEGENCADDYSYTVETSGSSSVPQTQTFCRNGSVAHLELRNQATVSLLVPEQKDLAPSLFTLMPKALQKKGRTLSVVPDPNTRVIISRKKEGPECTVCVGEGTSRTCGLIQTLSQSQNMTVEFSCLKPQDIFTVEVNMDLDCSMNCNYDTIHPENTYFLDFNRSFTWDLKVGTSESFQLDFPQPGMRQIPSTDSCPDKHTYNIFMYPRTGTVGVGTFCRNGPINRIQALYKGRITLDVPKDTTLTLSDFKYSKTSGSVSAIVDAALPRGQSHTDFFSASGMPGENEMKWNFGVQPLHNFTISVLDYKKPQCQSKDVKVTYQQDNKAPIEKAPTDEQPSNFQGNFSMSLTNCNAVRKTGAPGLFLHYRVSVFRSGIPYLCTVDLQNVQGLSLQIENMNPTSFCELRMDSVVQDKITVPSGSKAELSFLDCSSDELLLTVIKIIECQNLSSCSESGNLLTVPALDSCLLMPLRKVKWDLRVPEQGSVELSSPQGNLHQSVEGQECEGPISMIVSETGGPSIGRFCSLTNQGAIQKVQIFSNVTITVSAMSNNDLSKEKGPFFNVSFGSEISETMIYTMSVSNSVQFGTPNWPGAMKSDSTVSWIITIPEDSSAELLLLNLSQPRCHQSHTMVAIQKLDSKEWKSFREDDQFESKYSIPSSFYLNMSNCEPERGAFAALTKVSLEKKSRKLLSIILAVVGALLVIMIIILAVVCVVVRKKKRQINRSSIFLPKGPVSLPGDASFFKPRGEPDSPVYASIDDTMVYGHLLKEDGQTDRAPGNFNGHQVSTYRTFTGPMETAPKDTGYEPGQGTENAYHPFLAQSETFMPSRPLGPTGSVGYEDRRMVDNELYTFKTPGEPNPIRLSVEEPLPPPDPETSSWSEYDEAEPQYDMPM